MYTLYKSSLPLTTGSGTNSSKKRKCITITYYLLVYTCILYVYVPRIYIYTYMYIYTIDICLHILFYRGIRQRCSRKTAAIRDIIAPCYYITRYIILY